MPRATVITVSDSCARGERPDLSGPEAVLLLRESGFEVGPPIVVADDRQEIAAAIRDAAARSALVVTTGGTGLAARDMTPEATLDVLEREAPGIAEALRMSVYPRFPRAALSRGLAGTRGRTLIVNLPGSPGGVADGLQVLDPFIEHAVGLVRGTNTAHDTPDPETA